ncbi:MAG TPA: MFS transporter [Burkholderiales bacterium]|nr:MFS transporter [Burkholderiales bacterium]
MLAVFCPFAAGYFLSFFFRNVNAVISKDLAREFSLSPSDLGFLTSMYMLAFAAIQLPVGVLLDRYGPRRVVTVLLCVAGAGALTFGLAQDFVMLSVGRAMIGIGVSAGLMGAIKAFTLWFPLSRLATLNGLYLAAGGLGGLSATAPAEAIIGAFGWRVLFYGLAAAAVGASMLVLFVVPEKKLPGSGESLRQQFAAFGRVFSSVPFWRINAAFVLTLSAYQALQGLWLAPWLYDIAGLDRPAVARYLLVTSLAYVAGSVIFGVSSDRLARAGVPRMTVYKLGVAVSIATFCLLAAGTTRGLAPILTLYGFATISGALAYPLMTALFGPEMTGRVNTASNVMMFACSFAFQWGIGAVLRLFPVAGASYAAAGYATAFWILAALQIAAFAWLLPMKEARGYEPRL